MPAPNGNHSSGCRQTVNDSSVCLAAAVVRFFSSCLYHYSGITSVTRFSYLSDRTSVTLNDGQRMFIVLTKAWTKYAIEV
jgi:hypothetical protein